MNRNQLTVNQLYDLVTDKLIYEEIQIYIQHVSRTIYGGHPYQYRISLDISLYNKEGFCLMDWCKKRYGTKRPNRLRINEYRTDP